MSTYYNPKRTRNVFNPESSEPYKLSRFRIELFMNCQRCFYLDRRCGIDRPPSFPFNLNSAVDTLLKKEFDIHRADNTAHPLMQTYGIDAVPFAHKDMNKWRDALKGGVEYFHKETNFLLTGAPDDIWITPEGELIVVDYKATSKEEELSIDAPWQIGYKRQMEFYQWLLRRNGYTVAEKGYFVYCNGNTDAKAFDGKLEFDIVVLPHIGNDAWIEPTIFDIKKCLTSSIIPESSQSCDYCAYRKSAKETEDRINVRTSKLL